MKPIFKELFLTKVIGVSLCLFIFTVGPVVADGEERSHGAYTCTNINAVDFDTNGEPVGRVATDTHQTLISQGENSISVTYGPPGFASTVNYFGRWVKDADTVAFFVDGSDPTSPLHWSLLVLTHNNGHVTFRPTANGQRAFEYTCERNAAVQSGNAETNNPENLLKKLGDSWVDLRSEVKEGEFCKLSGTKFVADNASFFVLTFTLFEQPLDSVVYLNAQLIKDDQIEWVDAVKFPNETFKISAWSPYQDWPGKIAVGIDAVRFLIPWVESEQRTSELLANGIIPDDNEFIRFIFYPNNPIEVAFDPVENSDDPQIVPWINCVNGILKRVTERRNKMLGRN